MDLQFHFELKKAKAVCSMSIKAVPLSYLHWSTVLQLGKVLLRCMFSPTIAPFSADPMKSHIFSLGELSIAVIYAIFNRLKH